MGNRLLLFPNHFLYTIPLRHRPDEAADPTTEDPSGPPMSTFQPADNLRSRTFVGLLIAQFLAAFNDQAIHASAMFFAINQHALSKKDAISLMPILFYAPWALFSTLAGYLADKHSKRYSLVFWKFAEVTITALALLGFWLGNHGDRAGPWIVLSTVFLMGMHSAFFVPAKYGVMPEILQAHMLSRGNGLLESLSFLAIILGTVFGGVLSYYCRGQEYVIGIVLVALAVIGAGASLLIEAVPPANPDRQFPTFLYGPLYHNVKMMLRSRPLAFAVVGIAFFTFIVAFMRATVYMHGESQLPRWSELKTSVVVGMVALGIGIGSPLVGFLSAGKVELGLVPVGALGMSLATIVAAFALQSLSSLVAGIIAMGFFTGFYIVPLFTLLQHRAPRASKGDAIATSNVINVTGAILASLVFFGINWATEGTSFAPRIQTEPEIVYDKHRLPVLLFLSAAAMTLFTLLLLWIQLPSLFYRTLLWLRWRGRAKLEVFGLNHLPDLGPVLLVVGNGNREACLQAYSATDRTTHFLLPVEEAGGRLQSDPDRALAEASRSLRKGQVVGLSLPEADLTSTAPLTPAELLYATLTREVACPIVPVVVDTRPLPGMIVPRVYVVVGEPQLPGTTAEAVREALRRLAQEFDQQLATGKVQHESFAGAH